MRRDATGLAGSGTGSDAVQQGWMGWDGMQCDAAGTTGRRMRCDALQQAIHSCCIASHPIVSYIQPSMLHRILFHSLPLLGCTNIYIATNIGRTGLGLFPLATSRGPAPPPPSRRLASPTRYWAIRECRICCAGIKRGNGGSSAQREKNIP